MVCLRFGHVHSSIYTQAYRDNVRWTNWKWPYIFSFGPVNYTANHEQHHYFCNAVTNRLSMLRHVHKCIAQPFLNNILIWMLQKTASMFFSSWWGQTLGQQGFKIGHHTIILSPSDLKYGRSRCKIHASKST